MRHDKLERELNLLVLLTENRMYTIPEICRKMDISRRNFYYYLEFFRDSGFIVEKNGNKYSISRESPFFKKIVESVTFTEDEAVAMRRLLESAGSGNVLVENLKNKLDRFYDFNIIDNDIVRRQRAHNVSMLYDAIKCRQLAVLKNYSSPHSKTQRDRIVEPFMLMNNNNEIRCYELGSGMNKTFKVSRMEDVCLLDLRWEHEDDHRQVYTDLFMFSGEEKYNVTLRLGTLSCNILKEEYPKAAAYITAESDSSWLLSIDVCNYAGIGRFVMGLYEDIEVLGNEAFKTYLAKKISRLKTSL